MHSRGFNSPNIHFHFVNFPTFFSRVNKQKPNLRPTFGSNLSFFAISYYFRAFSNTSRHLDFFWKKQIGDYFICVGIYWCFTFYEWTLSFFDNEIHCRKKKNHYLSLSKLQIWMEKFAHDEGKSFLIFVFLFMNLMYTMYTIHISMLLGICWSMNSSMRYF